MKSYATKAGRQTFDRSRSEEYTGGTSSSSGATSGQRVVSMSTMMQSALSDANNNIDDIIEQGRTTTRRVTSTSGVTSTSEVTGNEVIPNLTNRCNNPPTTLLDNIDLEFSSSSGHFSITLHQVIGR